VTFLTTDSSTFFTVGGIASQQNPITATIHLSLIALTRYRLQTSTFLALLQSFAEAMVVITYFLLIFTLFTYFAKA